MKSIYQTPKMTIVTISNVDIVTDSSGIGGETNEFDARERRNPIWDED